MNPNGLKQRKYQLRGCSSATECVILVHGLARTCRSMASMETHLIEAGYQTLTVDYPSRKKRLEVLVSEDFNPVLKFCGQQGFGKIHCVTHSLGGIIVRLALAVHKPHNLGRVVMLSPPNQGSLVAEKLKKWWLFKLVNGPAGQQLATFPDCLPGRSGPVDYEVGVITGNRHVFFDSWFASFFSGDNDGKVAVEEARLEGMKDFLIVPETHPFIMNSYRVREQALFFLQQGFFHS